MNSKVATVKAKLDNKHKETKPVPKVTNNAFASAADALGAGIDALFAQNDEPEFMADLGDIEIIEQVRGQMEDDEQDLLGLGNSLAKYQIQAILLRIMPAGHPKPYRLIAGERRYRAAELMGLPQLRAKAREMTDEEAGDFQFAENIHRKNLTQIEEAKKIQRDLDHLGSVEAVLEKHQKSRAWLSKILSLLDLPEQAKRLVAENVSADVEVINAVKTVEKVDPVRAKALVDDLKKTRGKANARDKVAAVKDEVKPSKKPKGEKVPKWLEEQRKGYADQGGTMATPKDRSHEQPSAGDIFAGAKTGPHIEGGSLFDADASTRAVGFSPKEALNNAYTSIFEFGASPKTVLDVMRDEDRESVETFLNSFYDAGKQAKDVGRAVIRGFRNGQFSSDGDGAFSLVAFLQGADYEAKFDLLNIFGCAKV